MLGAFKLPMNSEQINEFERYHSITIPEWWEQGRELLDTLLSARSATLQSLVNINQATHNAEPTFGIFVHLTERSYEQVVGAIVCFVTANAATTEVAARVAIESAVNIQFILAGDRNSLILAWFRDYLSQDSKQIKSWEELAESLDTNEKQFHSPRISTRQNLNQSRRNILMQFESELGLLSTIDLKARWPHIKERFDSIGESIAYRNVYGRLSSQTHTDAEDTINYMICKTNGDNALIEQMSLETLAFSEFFMVSSVEFYLQAMKKTCATFSISVPTELERAIEYCISHMNIIADDWGW
jgi:predicted O-linked N-acetylglucosamine transferase (SPINDLY family)